jgi:hypothetical protein
MELTLHLGIIVCAVEFICFFIKGLAAFGDPLISNPVLSLFMLGGISILMKSLIWRA